MLKITDYKKFVYPQDKSLWPMHINNLLEELNIDKVLLIYAVELASIPREIDTIKRSNLEMLILCLLIAIEQGNVRLSLKSELLTKFSLSELQIQELLNDSKLACIISNNENQKPLMFRDGYLYTNRTLTSEIDLANNIKRLINKPSSDIDSYDIDMSCYSLDHNQLDAILLAIHSKLTLITGGPGTGKTYIGAIIIASLIHYLNIDIDKIAIAAPTGKATQRIGNAIKDIWHKLDHSISDTDYPEPKTLHRLLLWQPEKLRFYHNENNPISAKVVLIDEASMISQELMNDLLKAIQCDTRIILMGDIDQIPSIDSGCVFRDMVAILKRNTKHLTINHRIRNNIYSKQIPSLANAINTGDQDLLLNLLNKINNDKQNINSVKIIEESSSNIFLKKWFDDLILNFSDFQTLINRHYYYDGNWGNNDENAIDKILTQLNKFRILCVMKNNAGLRCVNNINILLHHYMLDYTSSHINVPFCYGEPAIVTKNNYKQELFNGDCGVILKVILQNELKPALVLPKKNGFHAISIKHLQSRIDLSYAMTIHKAQGSEYDNVAIMLPKYNHPGLTRELLYTAVTRARKSITLYGNAEQILWAARNNVERDTGLQLKLNINNKCDM